MAKFTIGNRVRGRTGLGGEMLQGMRGTVKAQIGRRAVGNSLPVVYEPAYDVHFDGMEETTQLVSESSLVPA